MPPPCSTPYSRARELRDHECSPHYSETPTTIPPFDIAKVGVLPRMSPITDQENALLNITPGSPIRHAAPPGLDRGQGRSGRSSCSDSPMSLGSTGAWINPGTGSKGAYPAGDTLDIRRTGKGCPEVPWRKKMRRWMLWGATTPIRPKTELIATSTRPSHLVQRAAG